MSTHPITRRTKTPEQAAREAARAVLRRFDLDPADGTDALTEYGAELGHLFTYEEGLWAIVEAAIEADRAQRATIHEVTP